MGSQVSAAPNKSAMLSPSSPSQPVVPGVRFTRRQTIISGGAAIGALALLQLSDIGAAALQDATIPAPILPGVIERIDYPDIIHLRNSAGSAVIRLVPGAGLRRGYMGRTAELAAFPSDDEVVAEGLWEGDTFVATSLMSLYHTIFGRIVGRRGNRLQIDGPLRELVLMPESTAAGMYGVAVKRPEQLAVGDDVVGWAWREPSSGAFLVARIGLWRAG
jgi:hypothetical protein